MLPIFYCSACLLGVSSCLGFVVVENTFTLFYLLVVVVAVSIVDALVVAVWFSL